MQYQVASQSPLSQAAFRSSGGGIFSLCQKAPASFPPNRSSHWPQRVLRSFLSFANRVSDMNAGFRFKWFGLGVFDGSVEALAAHALMN